MKPFILILLATSTLLSGIALPRAIEATLHAQDLWFDVAMGPNTARSGQGFVRIPGTDTTVYIGGLGTFCVFRNGQPADAVTPYPGFRGPLSFAVGSFGDMNVVDGIVVSTFAPSTHPLILFNPGPPPSEIGQTNIPMIATTGIRMAVADVDADRTPELVVVSGPGAPTTVSIVPTQGTNDTISFLAFDPSYTGGAFVAAGDLNGDGKAEVLVSQQAGGEVQAFELRGGEAHLRGTMRPQGHDYNGGFRLAAGDFNGDRRAEVITGAMTGQARVRVIDISVPSGRLMADTLVSNRPAEPSLGGTPVAYGRFDEQPAVLIAHFNSVFKVIDPGDPQPKIFSENPFLVVASLFMDVQTYTPPGQ